MQPTQRHLAPGIDERLLAQPQRFRFAQAVNLVLAALRRQGVPYEAAFRDVVRFGNSLSLAFPASEVEAIEVEWQAAPHGARIGRIHITPAFIGLLGASGALPLHDSERLAEQLHSDSDASQHALIDVFTNRVTAMFYESWAKYRVEQGLQGRGQDGLRPMLAALAGQGAGAKGAYYAGILRRRPVSASAIERLLGGHFSIPIRLEPLVGCWDEIAPRRRSTLGVNPLVLGRGVALGTRMWRHDLRARLHVGPLDEAQLANFLPGGGARAALVDMLAMFAVPNLAWEIRLLLAPPCVRPLTLATRSAPRKLGWTSFLTATAGVTRSPQVASLLRLR